MRVCVCVGGRGGGLYMNMLDTLCMYMEFAFGWCVGWCECVGMVMGIGGFSMMCVSHCMAFMLRIFMVVGCSCEV